MAILVTGSSGLIGAALVRCLRRQGVSTVGVDERPSPQTNIARRLRTSNSGLDELIGQVDGIVHLAGVSRVVWGQADPGRCWQDNVLLTSALIDAALTSRRRPWFIYASSREVYGEKSGLPIRDDAPLAPLNVYACSKAAAEALVERAVRHGSLVGAVLRFSSVYGGLEDHDDRVIPAFVHAALRGDPITVFGSETAIDPTWIDDAVDGVARLIERLDAGVLPTQPILLSGGETVPLLEIARMARALTGSQSQLNLGPPRTFDVARFAGLPLYADEFLGWRPATGLTQGLDSYIGILRTSAAA